jgi:LPS-assembly protein
LPRLSLYSMRSQLQCVITAGLLCHLFLVAPPLASQAQALSPADAGATQSAPEPCHAVLPAPPALSSSTGSGQKPGAAKRKGKGKGKAPARRAAPSQNQPVDITAQTCEQVGKIYTLRGNVKIKFGEYVFQGDTVTYDSVSGDASASGNAALDGGPRDMHITGSYGKYNVRSQTGEFHDVKGTTGARFRGTNVTLTSSSPIAFAADVMEQSGPDEYILYHGSVTSCELPHPKWRFHAAKIILRVADTAKLYQSTFRLKGVPILYLPYASTPAEKLGRQSGFLIPTVAISNTKGTIVGDSYYWAINRSMDATLGGQYLSKIGWMLLEDFRAKPSQTSFLNFSYFQVLTHQTVDVPNAQNGIPVNEGGEDIKLNAAAVFPHDVRGVASLEYLSSFVFREQFSPTFTQAVNSEVSSTAFLSKSVEGFSFNGYLDRYQNFQSTAPGNVITILHTPAIETDGVEQRIAGSPVYWSYDVAAEGLKRSEPGFVTPDLVGRFDINPDVSLPLFLRGWTFRPSLDLRETLYTQQDVPGPSGPVPIENDFNRRTIGVALDFRPPTVEKVFDHPLAGRKVKHTIEPYAVYRYTNGVENFASIIRFDFRDILSNTNEVEYGLMQRLYLKRLHSGCDVESKSEKDHVAPSALAMKTTTAGCTPSGADEFVTWELKQKYFLDPNFGGAVVNGTRNVFTTTDALTGIAFVTAPRRFSPIVSRVNFRTSSGSDLGWALDFDTTKGQINSSTLYATYHFGNYFVGGSEAYMKDVGEIVFAPPGSTTPLPPCVPGGLSSTGCVPQVYNQVRALVGYGSPSKRGWSAAGNIGYDFEFQTLQYGAAQGAYNWDCCGIAVEYRRFSLGSIRNENQFRFAFTLANIGTFGNMKRQERLF